MLNREADMTYIKQNGRNSIAHSGFIETKIVGQSEIEMRLIMTTNSIIHDL